MVERIANSDTTKPSSVLDTFNKEDQEALQKALDNYLEQSFFNILSRTHQQINDEFKEPVDY